jgi:dipeptidyl aminopeptidase/acylaminoacyl peptidase
VVKSYTLKVASRSVARIRAQSRPQRGRIRSRKLSSVSREAAKTPFHHSRQLKPMPTRGGMLRHAWSPDGLRIAYERVIDPGTSASAIVIADPDGSDAHVIELASLGSGAAMTFVSSDVLWSPDGRHLLFWGCCGPTGGTPLVSVSATGEPAPVVLASGSTILGGGGLSWQPVFP